MTSSIVALLLLILSISAMAQRRYDYALTSMIPHPYWKSIEGGHKVMAINSGLAALQLRLEMIERAQKNIEVEYFIYNTDFAGKIITKALIEKAKQGVKVRILIDKSVSVFKFNEFYAKELNTYGIKVRYYNDAMVARVSTIQFRNHRKLISIDDNEAITGGRNIGNDYFDLSHEFNFYDRDIYVQGPIVQTMREAFDNYFEHSITERPKFRKRPHGSDPALAEEFDKKTNKAKAFLGDFTANERVALQKIEEIGKDVLAQTKLHDCPVTSYATDAPGASFISRLNPNFNDKYKFLRKALYDKIMAIDKEIYIDSPYVLNNENTNEVLNELLRKNVKLNIYTNSLASTDAVYVAANLYLDILKWKKMGLNIYLHDGKWLNETPVIDNKIKNARWGTHSKSQIYEVNSPVKYSEVMIGTYNIDNRSNFYNSEMAVFCRGNDEFTAEVKGNLLSRIEKGITINKDGTATDSSGKRLSLYGADTDDVMLMKLITLPSWLLKFLL